MMAGTPIRVLIVDDSAIVRKVLTELLSAEPDIEVAGLAPDPYIARDKILSLAPDVITLDIEMPRMDGLTFLDRLMKHHPLPVVVISSLGHSDAALEALRRGAVDVLAKPGGPYSVGDLRHDLAARIRSAAATRRPRPSAIPKGPPEPAPKSREASEVDIVAIGASTGGVTAIEQVLTALPPKFPALVIAQHIPPGFSAAFARRLDGVCRLHVKEAEDGDLLRSGLAVVAPGNFHLRVEKTARGYQARLDSGPRVCYQRPSVDVLFHSVAKSAGKRTAAAILTGMGNDGAEGMLAMRKQGAFTIAQDEASSVVYGMPREAVLLGAISEVLPLSRIADALCRHTLQSGADLPAASRRAEPGPLQA